MIALDDTQRMLRDSVAAFVARTGGADRVRAHRDQVPGFDRAIWREMAAAGWFGLRHPEAVGGLGLGMAELAVVMEELGRGLAPEPVGAAAVLASTALLHGTGGARRDELLAGLVAGEVIPVLAWQERAGDHRGGAVETLLDSGNRITGTKRFLPLTEGADGFVVSARRDDGVALVWVAPEAGGLRVTAERAVDGGTVGTLTLERVAVDEADILVGSGAGDAIDRAVEEARLAASAELLGVMSAALDLTVEFVKQRVQFGRPIGSFQALQHRIVDLWTRQELARAAVRHAADVLDKDGDPDARLLAVAAAKARCSDAALLITRQAIQLHGGMGYTDEAQIGLFLKRALVLSAWLGNARAQRDRVARIAMGLEGEAP